METPIQAIERPDADECSDTMRVWEALHGVTDPEIPVVSVVDMGMIPSVKLVGGRIVIRMMPTFAGCPALTTIRENIRRAVELAGFADVQVEAVFDPPWTTDRITVAGRKRLREFGLAPPSKTCGGGVDEALIASVLCPFCNSSDTKLESIFGPTLCRAIHYCDACQQSFEQFKPI